MLKYLKRHGYNDYIQEAKLFELVVSDVQMVEIINTISKFSENHEKKE